MSFCYKLFLVTFLSSTLLCGCSGNVINEICSQATNAAYCTNYLGHLYRPGESLLNLAKSTVGSTLTGLNLAQDYIRVSLLQTSDPALKQIYLKCQDDVKFAIGSIFSCGQILRSNVNIGKVAGIAASAMNQVGKCDKEFNARVREPAGLKKITKEAVDNVSSFVALSKRLA